MLIHLCPVADILRGVLNIDKLSSKKRIHEQNKVRTIIIHTGRCYFRGMWTLISLNDWTVRIQLAKRNGFFSSVRMLWHLINEGDFHVARHGEATVKLTWDPNTCWGWLLSGHVLQPLRGSSNLPSKAQSPLPLHCVHTAYLCSIENIYSLFIIKGKGLCENFTNNWNLDILWKTNSVNIYFNAFIGQHK